MQILTAENIELYILLPTVTMVISSTDFETYLALFCRYRIYHLQSLKWGSINKQKFKKREKKNSIELHGGGKYAFSYWALGQLFITVSW